jgi:hypothetical protein
MNKKITFICLMTGHLLMRKLHLWQSLVTGAGWKSARKTT